MKLHQTSQPQAPDSGVGRPCKTGWTARSPASLDCSFFLLMASWVELELLRVEANHDVEEHSKNTKKKRPPRQENFHTIKILGHMLVCKRGLRSSRKHLNWGSESVVVRKEGNPTWWNKKTRGYKISHK